MSYMQYDIIRSVMSSINACKKLLRYGDSCFVQPDWKQFKLGFTKKKKD